MAVPGRWPVRRAGDRDQPGRVGGHHVASSLDPSTSTFTSSSRTGSAPEPPSQPPAGLTGHVFPDAGTTGNAHPSTVFMRCRSRDPLDRGDRRQSNLKSRQGARSGNDSIGNHPVGRAKGPGATTAARRSSRSSSRNARPAQCTFLRCCEMQPSRWHETASPGDRRHRKVEGVDREETPLGTARPLQEFPYAREASPSSATSRHTLGAAMTCMSRLAARPGSDVAGKPLQMQFFARYDA